MTDKRDGENEDSRRKPSRFGWVRKLMQSSSQNTSSKSTSLRNTKRRPTETEVKPYVQEPPSPPPPPPPQSEREPQTQFADSVSRTSNKLSSKSPSITHESVLTRQDNISTMPVISMSTMSVRSSTFSENSTQSSSPTMASEHPTLFTNASTVGIPPASIFDRRERSNNVTRSIHSHPLHITSDNSSTYTLATADSVHANPADQMDFASRRSRSIQS